MKGYTSRARIENYLVISIDPGFYQQVDDWIEEIEAYIDQQTGRNFIADTTASARKFDGCGGNSILIDDCVAVTKLETGIDAPLTEIVSSAYLTMPNNALAKLKPIWKLQLRSGSFPNLAQIVTVTGKWGYSVDVPGDIRQAATVLVAGVINYAWHAEGEIKQMSIGRYAVTYKDEKQWQDFDRIADVLESYVKHTF